MTNQSTALRPTKVEPSRRLQDTTRGATATDLRESNASLVFSFLKVHSPCSRADLARLTGLTAPTISALVDDFRRRSLVKIRGQGASTGGRPPTIVEINTTHWHVVGVNIGAVYVRLALADLSGGIVARESIRLGADHTPETVTDLIAAGVERLCATAGITRKRILLIASGAPGITDVGAGVVLSAPNLDDWDNIPLRDLIEDKTGISCIVENDVNLGALGEYRCGAAKGVSDFVFLAIGTGVGAGIILNGSLHRGALHSAGEVGYMMLPGLPQKALKLNKAGAFESVIGGRSIEETWQRRAKNPPLTATEIFDRAKEGDARAKLVLERTAQHLAAAITNISLVLDISLVVLGGGVGRSQSLLEATDRLLRNNQFSRPRLMVSQLGIDAEIFGAVRLALQTAEVHGYRRRAPDRKRRVKGGAALASA